MVFYQVEHFVKMVNDLLIKYDMVYYLMYRPFAYSSLIYLVKYLYTYYPPTHLPIIYLRIYLYLLITYLLVPIYVFHLRTTYLLTHPPTYISIHLLIDF